MKVSEEGKMESLGSVWGYQEGVDELKNMLLYTTYELESAKNEAQEEMKINEENVKQLLHLLKVACQERDEAKDQLNLLLNKLMLSPIDICPVLPSLQPETPPVYPMKENSSHTESDSISETYNHHSYGSSQVDSFLGVVSSPELSNLNNMADSSNNQVSPYTFVQEYNRSNSMGIVSSGVTEPDRASVVIENLVKGKVLPEKGRLLQSVMEAAPLLQTLLVSGPLPRWRNPPPLQPLQIPPFSIKGSDTGKLNQSLASNLNYPSAHNSLSLPYADLSYGSPQMYSNSTLNFTSISNTCLNKRKVASNGLNGHFIHNSIMDDKRQRCQ